MGEKPLRDMKAVAAMLACPHKWSEPKKVRVVTDGKKPRDGDYQVCELCGTNRVKWPDGTGTMFSPDALSSSPPVK
mgnify:CR=1 FL=1